MTANVREPIVHSPGIYAIPLTKGLIALIDEADVEAVSAHKWYAQLCDGRHYAAAHSPRPARFVVLLHRFILDLWVGGEVDHVNGDPLDNRRSNLRLASSRQNKHNMRVRRDSLVGYKGVQKHMDTGRWRARAKDLEGRQVSLGVHATPEDAARAYDRFVLATRGEFARTNFPQ